MEDAEVLIPCLSVGNIARFALDKQPDWDGIKN